MDRSIAGGSESKKRLFEETEDFEELGPKRPKIRDLQSVFLSEGKTKHNTASAIDLNVKDDVPSCVEDTSVSQNCVKSRVLAFDLNSEDVSSSINHDVFHPYQDHDQVKVKPLDSSSECGSTCNLGGEPDSMRVWKEMKQNGFLSSSHGGVPVPHIPKSRGRKKGKESVIKKKIEIAKKEQVDRFAKVAAPSGLLNELNPGIINHVRNRKQVHSIIENLVRSGRRDENKHGGRKQDVGKECCEAEEFSGHDNLAMNDQEIVAKMCHYASFNNLECEGDILALKLSSSGTMASNTSSLSNEELGNVSTVNSLSNVCLIGYRVFAAATVASQWLELLHQDIKGRLAALRRSRKRVEAAIQRELPLLASSELGCNQENNDSENGHFEKGTTDLHRARWAMLFHQMDAALSEEEKHLESSLNQVNDMRMHCENGLQQFHPESGLQKRIDEYSSSSNGALSFSFYHDVNRNLKVESSKYKDLAVQAAAAAIYSTSNFLQSMENLPCF
ncbi:hypothetical protein SSX86_003728 [Deinandra increscens subsp. villosa]|uniref:Uncharacterized protein n=1 Tax=Deinandra increscens subsp. villosa TaxID=3103831 RepID=A0AAP0HA79_9ASTR